MNNFSRATSALILMASLLSGSMAAVGQTTAPKPAAPQAKTTDTKQTASTAPATSTATNKKPLSTNEDPAMIGKRNINGGFVGKISGGTEKEVRMGREAAADVDRQAKFIEDPIITEYVNRVGQNIVLHSDA